MNLGDFGPPPPPSLPTDSWRRIHPLSPVIRASRALIPIALILGSSLIGSSGRGGLGGTLGHLVLALVLVGLGLISWLVTRWRIEGGDLRIETGLLRRSSLRFPLAQIQAVDLIRPATARILGLSELRLRMAGSTGAAGRLAYLSAGEAEIVRAQLLALAHGVHVDTPAPPEQVLLTVDPGRLVASIILSPLAGIVTLVLIAVVVTSVVAPAVAGGVLTGSGTGLLGLVLAVWRRFSSNYGLTVADAPDGLRLKSGLVATAAETIPRGRVQAVRMVQPLLWRPFGWCRVEVDVAGKQRSGRESRSQSRPLRMVLPVGTEPEARWLLSRLLPDMPTNLVPPPPRARYKAPLRYHFLGCGFNQTCLVTTSGRLARVTIWVPLARVQSLRRVQGPVQSRLGLASLHLDTAGSRGSAPIPDRDVAEADQMLEQLSTLCRAAREPSHHV